MTVPRIPLLLLLHTLLAGCTSADPSVYFPPPSPPRVALPAATVEDADGVHARPAPAQIPGPAGEQPRRASSATIVRMPAPPAPPPAVPAPSLPATSAPVPPGPQPVNSCDAGGCWTPGGRVQGGTGNVHLDAGGRPCHVNGGWLQCF
ncbi:MAG TPA: hypothetical protein VIM12_01845 [Noviherbaspirillum sp.]|jgi:hypothetical protein|uniref:hypothetical protein n=1 Tax=Noviherbaspirillum sp. TaxID=1926288 RepID=UPI002F93BF1D